MTDAADEQKANAILEEFYASREYQMLLAEEVCAQLGLNLYEGVPRPNEGTDEFTARSERERLESVKAWGRLMFSAD